MATHNPTRYPLTTSTAALPRTSQGRSLQIVERPRAAPEIRFGVVVQMDPAVRRIFRALDDRPRLVHGAWLLQLGVRIERAGPEQPAALLGLHGKVQAREGRLAALLHVCIKEQAR
jgi:hypothetical protein